MNIPLIMLVIVVINFIELVLMARKGRQMNLEKYSIGGRKFGTIFVFLLMTGEIYTPFTLPSASGFSYSKGALSYYILCRATLSCTISYFMFPPIWQYAKDHRIIS